jgi:hypothetical protein
MKFSRKPAAERGGQCFVNQMQGAILRQLAETSKKIYPFPSTIKRAYLCPSYIFSD